MRGQLPDKGGLTILPHSNDSLEVKAHTLPARIALFVYLAVIPTAFALLLVAGRDIALSVPPLLFALPAVPVAIHVSRRSRAAWIVLMVHTSLLAAACLATMAFSPAMRLVLLAMVVEAMCVAGVFAMKDVRVPYLANDPRGFRKHARVETEIVVRMLSAGRTFDAQTYDVSEGGAYVVGWDPELVVGSRLTMEIGSKAPRLWLSAHIVAGYAQGVGTKPPGIALQFSSLRPSERVALRAAIASSHKKNRSLVALPIRVAGRGYARVAETAELSASGCSITGMPDLAPGDRVYIAISLHDEDVLDLMAEVVWAGELQFLDLHASDHQRLRERLTERDVLRA